jgi:tetratricopeptide (TPR) repeat protein
METAKLFIKRYTNNTEAYHLYLKGRYCWDKFSEEWIRKSIDYFRQAINLDSRYALAYAGLADDYFRLSATYLRPRDAWPMIILAATRAVEIDADLPEARASMGLVKHYHGHDWAGAEKEYQRAIELSPSSSFIRNRYGRHLLWAGRNEEALAEFERAKESDPLSLLIGLSIASYFYFTGQFERAIQETEKVLELDPNHYPTHMMLGLVHVHDPDVAIREFKLAFNLGRDYLALGEIGYVYAKAGDEARAVRMLDELLQLSQRRYVSPYYEALIYAGLGRTDQAFEALERLYEERDELLIYARVALELEGLRTDPRFGDLYMRAGLAESKA